MQPFMMMKLTQDTILYDSKFSNYGYNHVAYFENVRQAGYSFYILNNAFALDSPHAESECTLVVIPSSMFRANAMRSDKRLDLWRMMVQFQRQLTSKYETSHRIPLCAIPQTSYYEVLLES